MNSCMESDGLGRCMNSSFIGYSLKVTISVYIVGEDCLSDCMLDFWERFLPQSFFEEVLDE